MQKRLNKSICYLGNRLTWALGERERVKSFLSLTAHRAALISVPLALSQTPAYTAKTVDMGPVHRAACLSTPRRLGRYQIILLGDRGTWVWTTCPELGRGNHALIQGAHCCHLVNRTEHSPVPGREQQHVQVRQCRPISLSAADSRVSR